MDWRIMRIRCMRYHPYRVHEKVRIESEDEMCLYDFLKRISAVKRNYFNKLKDNRYGDLF